MQPTNIAPTILLAAVLHRWTAGLGSLGVDLNFRDQPGSRAVELKATGQFRSVPPGALKQGRKEIWFSMVISEIVQTNMII